MSDVGLAFLAGILQGLLEWLPVSSEGALTIATTALGSSVAVGTQFSLFLHAGTALAAIAFYRGELVGLLRRLPTWRPRSAFGEETADLSFYALATFASVATGGAGFLFLEELATATAGGVFVALIGLLLLGTGALLWTAESRTASDGGKAPIPDAEPEARTPRALDAVLVGLLQGLAILPGVSRSGTTVSALLLRGYAGPDAFRLSFVLSIPAAVGAATIVLFRHGIPAIGPPEAVIALGLSAGVGYLTVDALTRLARRVRFWRICIAFGALAITGGAIVAV